MHDVGTEAQLAVVLDEIPESEQISGRDYHHQDHEDEPAGDTDADPGRAKTYRVPAPSGLLPLRRS